MATIEQLEARIAELERVLDIAVRAMAPPMTIGELADVPTPGSQIAAQWAQEVSSRVVQRYANKVALDAWADAPIGARAVTTNDSVEFYRVGGGWARATVFQAATVGTGGTWIADR